MCTVLKRLLFSICSLQQWESKPHLLGFCHFGGPSPGSQHGFHHCCLLKFAASFQSAVLVFNYALLHALLILKAACTVAWLLILALRKLGLGPSSTIYQTRDQQAHQAIQSWANIVPSLCLAKYTSRSSFCKSHFSSSQNVFLCLLHSLSHVGTPSTCPDSCPPCLCLRLASFTF